LEIIGVILLLPFENNPKVKLIFVMIIYPLTFTAIQFWITDNIIKYTDENHIRKNEDKKKLEDKNNKETEISMDTEIGNSEDNHVQINQNNDSTKKPLLETV